MISNEECASQIDSPSLLNLYNIDFAKKQLPNHEILYKMPFLAAVIHSVDLSTGNSPKYYDLVYLFILNISELLAFFYVILEESWLIPQECHVAFFNANLWRIMATLS